MDFLTLLFVAFLPVMGEMIRPVWYTVLSACTVWLEFRNDRGRCKDALVVVPFLCGIVWVLCLILCYWAYYVSLPAVFWTLAAGFTVYCTGGTMQIVGELQERMQWLGAVRPPVDEHRN